MSELYDIPRVQRKEPHGAGAARSCPYHSTIVLVAIVVSVANVVLVASVVSVANDVLVAIEGGSQSGSTLVELEVEE